MGVNWKSVLWEGERLEGKVWVGGRGGERDGKSGMEGSGKREGDVGYGKWRAERTYRKK